MHVLVIVRQIFIKVWIILIFLEWTAKYFFFVNNFVHSEIRGGTLGHTIKDFLLSMSCLWHTNCVANPWDSKINPFNMYGANTNNIIITATNMNIACVVVMNDTQRKMMLFLPTEARDWFVWSLIPHRWIKTFFIEMFCAYHYQKG